MAGKHPLTAETVHVSLNSSGRIPDRLALFQGLAERPYDEGWLPTATALLFGREATLGGPVVDRLVILQSVAR